MFQKKNDDSKDYCIRENSRRRNFNSGRRICRAPVPNESPVLDELFVIADEEIAVLSLLGCKNEPTTITGFGNGI